jgi:hypothetical protein
MLQATAYALFALMLGYFASMPSYRYADASLATVKLSLTHTTERVEPCIKLTPEQIAELAANMRHTESCERERLPLTVELDVDGQTIVRSTARPSGLWNDGPASVYERFDVPAGKHTIAVRMRDSARSDGWDFEGSVATDLRPGHYFTVTFKPATGEFFFR